MLDLLIIQPTPFCNIDCSYCYLNQRDNKSRISLATIDRTIDRLMEDGLLGDTLTVVFHAGEPMVLQAEFYREIFALFESRFAGAPVKLQYSIQTNGTVIREAWCELIKEFNINIGISVDGPAFLHDQHRKTRKGEGTFHKVQEGIAMLQRYDIKYHGIAVITEASLRHGPEIFQFFYDHGFYSLGLNIEEKEGINESSSLFEGPSVELIREFYTIMFDLYIRSDKRMRIREFENSISSILRNPQVLDITDLDTHTHQTSPLGIISIDHKGDFSSYSPELLGQRSEVYNDFTFGNVHTSSFLQPEKQEVFNKVKLEIANGVANCEKSCDYFAVCGGGAPANKFYENNSFESTETQFCKYHIQIPIDIALKYLEDNFN